jgi:hypothetical protein
VKYDTQIGELKTKLDSANSVLVVLPKEVNTDKLASALALYLALKKAGKQVSIVSEAELKVAQTNLFGLGDIQKSLPENNSGNFVIKLDGIVEDGKVPALVKLDWFPTGNDLNLVFHVAPGKKFEPINLSHHYDTTNFQLVFFIGGQTLADFGTLYSNNVNQLGSATWVNIDNSQNNNLFAPINIVDTQTISLSEMVAQIIQGLSLAQDADIANNLISGIFEMTQNLTVNVSGTTFITVGQAMQEGGRVPFAQVIEDAGGLDLSQFANQSSDNTAAPVEEPVAPTQSEVITKGDRPIGVMTEAKTEPAPEADSQPTATSQFEVSVGEQAVGGNPESSDPTPDWLTPKVFGGKSLG